MPPLPVNNEPSAPTNGTVRANINSGNIQGSISNIAVPFPKMGLQPQAPTPQPTPAPVATQTAQPTQPQTTPQTTPQSASQTTTLPDGTQLDTGVLNVMRTIKQLETGTSSNPWNQSGDNGASFGAYQWNNGGKPIAQGQTPANWQTAAAKYLGNSNAPMTPANQNYVAYNQILAYKNQGLTPQSIDALWNGAKPDPNNPGQFVHISNTRAQQFNTLLPQIASGANSAQSNSSGLPTYGATFAASPNDNLFVGGLKTLGNIPSSLYGVATGLFGMVTHPLATLGTLGSGAIGAAENLTGQNTGAPDQYQQTANAIGTALMNRYGSLAALQNTVENDPAGFAADVAGLVAGGEGLARTGADAVDLATGSRGAIAAENAANYSQTGLNVMPQVGAARAAVDTGIGAINDTASSVLGKLATPITAPIRAVGNALFGGAQNAEMAAASARTGIDLAPSAYTNNQFINLGDALAATGAGATKFGKNLARAEEQLQSLANKTVSETMGSTDLQTAGEHIAQGAQQYGDAMKAQTDNLFNTFRSVLGGDVAAQTERSTSLLSGAISKMGSAGETSPYLQEKLDVLNGANGYPAPTLETLKNVRETVAAKIATSFGDPTVSGIKATLQSLYGTLSEDTRATLAVQGKPGLMELYDAAQNSAREGFQAIEASYAAKVRKLVEAGQQDVIVKSLVRPNMATSDIPRILEMAGTQGAADIRANFLQDIYDNAIDEQTGNFLPKKIDAALKKWGFNTRNDKVQAILGEGSPAIQQLKDLGTLSEGTQKLVDFSRGVSDQFLLKKALQLKPFAEGGLFAAGVWKIFTGDAATGIKLLATDVGVEGLSKFLASDTGQAFMKLGLKRGAALAAEAQKQGLTIPDQNASISPNESNGLGTAGSGSGGATPLGGAVGNSGLYDSAGTSQPTTPEVQLAQQVTPLKTVELNALAKAKNFDIATARKLGYSEQDIQTYLQGNNAGQAALPEGNPNAIPGPTIALPTSARESTLGLNEVRNTKFGKR